MLPLRQMQGFFQAFIYDIVSASDFKERQLSPLRDVSKAADEDPVAALLRDARQQYESWRSLQVRYHSCPFIHLNSI